MPSAGSPGFRIFRGRGLGRTAHGVCLLLGSPRTVTLLQIRVQQHRPLLRHKLDTAEAGGRRGSALRQGRRLRVALDADAPCKTQTIWNWSSPPIVCGWSKSQRSMTNFSHATRRLTQGRSVGWGGTGSTGPRLVIDSGQALPTCKARGLPSGPTRFQSYRRNVVSLDCCTSATSRPAPGREPFPQE